jgi:predicted helicase
MDLFALSVENTARIKRQNDKQISVIIGNPPYNAKQENFNDNNANRSYPEIDKRIKDTYIKQGTAQNQIVIYDMYTRFIRWATDRLNKNGIVAFITNSSFIDARAFDGFRKVVASEFSDIYIVDLGGNIRAGDKTGNVFNVQVGVAILFMVKKEEKNITPCKIFYSRHPEFNTAGDKLRFVASTKLTQIDFVHTTPDKQNNWINQTDNDFDSFIPLIDKDVKAGKSQEALFELFSRGVETTRDEWVYDLDKFNLINKINYFINVYNLSVESNQKNSCIKWSSSLQWFGQNLNNLKG